MHVVKYERTCVISLTSLECLLQDGGLPPLHEHVRQQFEKYLHVPLAARYIQLSTQQRPLSPEY
jgi:hypothetical protein